MHKTWLDFFEGQNVGFVIPEIGTMLNLTKKRPNSLARSGHGTSSNGSLSADSFSTGDMECGDKGKRVYWTRTPCWNFVFFLLCLSALLLGLFLCHFVLLFSKRRPYNPVLHRMSRNISWPATGSKSFVWNDNCWCSFDGFFSSTFVFFVSRVLWLQDSLFGIEGSIAL